MQHTRVGSDVVGLSPGAVSGHGWGVQPWGEQREAGDRSCSSALNWSEAWGRLGSKGLRLSADVKTWKTPQIPKVTLLYPLPWPALGVHGCLQVPSQRAAADPEPNLSADPAERRDLREGKPRYKPNLVWGIRVSGLKLACADTFPTSTTLCWTSTGTSASPFLSSEYSRGWGEPSLRVWGVLI